MGKTRPKTLVLDAGALIAFERADPRMRALCRQVVQTGARLVIPAGVVGQVWRDGARQVPLRALLSGPTSEVPTLDRALAEAAGVLCGRCGTADVIDASVVLIAKREQAVVLTGDPDDLQRLDPSLAIETV